MRSTCAAVLARLGELEVNEVLVEAGPTLTGALVRAGAGGRAAPLYGPPVAGPAGAAALRRCRSSKTCSRRKPSTSSKRSQVGSGPARFACGPANVCSPESFRTSAGSPLARRAGSTRGSSSPRRISICRIRAIGDSISVQGVCLTVMSLTRDSVHGGRVARDAFAHHAGRAEAGLARESRAGAARGRPARRAPGFRARGWRRACLGDQCRRRLAPRESHGPRRAGALHRAERFGHRVMA